MKPIGIVCALSLLFVGACANEHPEVPKRVSELETSSNNGQTGHQANEPSSDDQPSEYDIEKVKLLVARNPWFARLDRWDRHALIDCVGRKIADDQTSGPGSIWPDIHDDVHAAIDDIGLRKFALYEKYCPDLIKQARALM